jgi:hypothetical protein
MDNAEILYFRISIRCDRGTQILTIVIRFRNNRPSIRITVATVHAVEGNNLYTRIKEICRLINSNTILAELFQQMSDVDICYHLRNLMGALLRQSERWDENREGIKECLAIIFGMDESTFEALPSSIFNGKIDEHSNTLKDARNYFAEDFEPFRAMLRGMISAINAAIQDEVPAQNLPIEGATNIIAHEDPAPPSAVTAESVAEEDEPMDLATVNPANSATAEESPAVAMVIEEGQTLGSETVQPVDLACASTVGDADSPAVSAEGQSTESATIQSGDSAASSMVVDADSTAVSTVVEEGQPTDSAAIQPVYSATSSMVVDADSTAVSTVVEEGQPTDSTAIQPVYSATSSMVVDADSTAVSTVVEEGQLRDSATIQSGDSATTSMVVDADSIAVSTVVEEGQPTDSTAIQPVYSATSSMVVDADSTAVSTVVEEGQPRDSATIQSGDSATSSMVVDADSTAVSTVVEVFSNDEDRPKRRKQFKTIVPG